MFSYKTSIYQTSSYKTSILQNVLITKRPYYQTSRLPNVQLPNVQLQNDHTTNYYKTSSFFLFSNTDNYDKEIKKVTLTLKKTALCFIILYLIHKQGDYGTKQSYLVSVLTIMSMKDLGFMLAKSFAMLWVS